MNWRLLCSTGYLEDVLFGGEHERLARDGEGNVGHVRQLGAVNHRLALGAGQVIAQPVQLLRGRCTSARVGASGVKSKAPRDRGRVWAEPCSCS